VLKGRLKGTRHTLLQKVTDKRWESQLWLSFCSSCKNGDNSTSFCTTGVVNLSNECEIHIFNGVLKEYVYAEQLLGYMEFKKESKVFKLKKTLYGLKQEPQVWNTWINTLKRTNSYNFLVSMLCT